MNTICHDRTFETQIITNIRALIKFESHGSVAERINHEASDVFTYCEESLNHVRGTLNNFSYALSYD